MPTTWHLHRITDGILNFVQKIDSRYYFANPIGQLLNSSSPFRTQINSKFGFLEILFNSLNIFVVFMFCELHLYHISNYIRTFFSEAEILRLFDTFARLAQRKLINKIARERKYENGLSLQLVDFDSCARTRRLINLMLNSFVPLPQADDNGNFSSMPMWFRNDFADSM